MFWKLSSILPLGICVTPYQEKDAPVLTSLLSFPDSLETKREASPTLLPREEGILECRAQVTALLTTEADIDLTVSGCYTHNMSLGTADWGQVVLLVYKDPNLIKLFQE